MRTQVSDDPTFTNGVFTVSGHHAYGEGGKYLIGVTASHDKTQPLTISDPNPSVTRRDLRSSSVTPQRCRASAGR